MYTFLVFRLSGYLLRETIGLYIFGVAAFWLLLSIDLLTSWAKFLIEQEASLGTVGRLMLYKLPFFLHLSLPMAVVFAILLATGRLSKDSELKAAYSLGARPLILLIPLLTLGLAASGLALLNNGFIEPVAERSYEALKDSFFYTRPPAESQNNVAYRNVDKSIYFAGKIVASSNEDTEEGELSGVYILQPDGTTISAPSGIWKSETKEWVLNGAQVVAPNGAASIENELALPFELESEVAESLAEDSTLTLAELNERLLDVNQTGRELRNVRFSFHTRIADAFSALVFALIAGILGLQLHGRAAGFGWTIALLVMFWALWTLQGSLFEQGVLSPIAAAWFTSGVVAVVAFAIAWWRLR